MSAGRCVVLIDAGYLLAAAAVVVMGSQHRRGVEVDHAGLVTGLRDVAQADSGLLVQRVIWYDAAPGGHPTDEHRRIGRLDRVTVRIGRIGVSGEPKGVDVRLALDLLDLASSGRISTLYLVSGDDDLTEAVDRAQEYGVEVVLLAVPATTRVGVMSVADHLAITADRTLALSAGLLTSTIRPPLAAPTTASASPAAGPRPRPPAGPPVPQGAPGVDQVWVRSRLDEVADRLARTVTGPASTTELGRLLRGRPSIPAEIDRVLLTSATTALQTLDLTEGQRRDLRAAFWDALDELTATGAE